MKTTTASLFLLFIFLITQPSSLFGVANGAKHVVLDREGNEVLTGVPYFVLPVFWGFGGGGLAIGRERDRKCPEIVIQSPLDGEKGNLMVFFSANSSDGVVCVSSDVRVMFVGPRDKLCQTSTVWKVQGEGQSSGKRWVELGESGGEASCDTVDVKHCN